MIWRTSVFLSAFNHVDLHCEVPKRLAHTPYSFSSYTSKLVVAFTFWGYCRKFQAASQASETNTRQKYNFSAVQQPAAVEIGFFCAWHFNTLVVSIHILRLSNGMAINKRCRVLRDTAKIWLTSIAVVLTLRESSHRRFAFNEITVPYPNRLDKFNFLRDHCTNFNWEIRTVLEQFGMFCQNYIICTYGALDQSVFNKY